MKKDRIGSAYNPRCPYCGGPARCACCGQTCREVGGLTDEGLCAGCSAKKAATERKKEITDEFWPYLFIAKKGKEKKDGRGSQTKKSDR